MNIIPLPSPLMAALERELAAVPPAALASAAAALSERYRHAKPGSPLLRGATDAAAYAAFRLPATYAAVQAVFQEVHARRPDWSPESLLDAGAGPGTALWAALAVWPSLTRLTALERDAAMRALGRRLASAAPTAALRQSQWREADLTGSWEAERHDLVVAAYVLGELATDAQDGVVAALWRCTGGVLVLIEPGTPAGFARIRAARAALIAMGAHLWAPCPHAGRCPLLEGDWCHFAQRVARTRLLRQIKGGTLAYEDEKFSYLAAGRQPVSLPARRVVRRPSWRTGHVRLHLCTPSGLEEAVVSRKAGPAYRAARELTWGSAWPGVPSTSAAELEAEAPKPTAPPARPPER